MTNRCFKRTQVGRSMVEMLGTLAIMGVLSIGAIVGFNYAMNKHRANELLDEARKRAYTVMTQIQLGLSQSLSEYTNHNTLAGGTFSPNIVTANLSGQFGLEVTGVLGRVCENLKATVSENTIIRKIFINGTKAGACESENNILVLVYNNDLSTIPYASDFDGDKKMCQDKGYTYCDLNGYCLSNECCSGYKNATGSCVCDNGYIGAHCEVITCTTGQYCGPHTGCCAAGEICTTVGAYDGECIRNPAGTCTVNADCNTINPNLCADDKCFCWTEVDIIGGHSILAGGDCVALTEVEGRLSKQVKDASGHIIYPEGKWLIGPKMNFWAARNWCQAQGSQLVKMAELGLSKSISDPTDQVTWDYLRQAFSSANGVCWTSEDATSAGEHAWGPFFHMKTPYANTPNHGNEYFPICR